MMSITDIFVGLDPSIPYSFLVYIMKGYRAPLKNVFQSMIIMSQPYVTQSTIPPVFAEWTERWYLAR